MNPPRKSPNHLFWTAFWLTFLTVAIAGCGENPIPANIFFPQIASNTYMDAELAGELVLEKTCLRVSSRVGETSYLLVWPPDFSVRERNGQIQVLDETGQILAAIGDEVRLGGGEVPKAFREDLEGQIGQSFPNECPGPYWIVSPLE